MLPPFECCLDNSILHESFIMGYSFTLIRWRTSFYNLSILINFTCIRLERCDVYELAYKKLSNRIIHYNICAVYHQLSIKIPRSIKILCCKFNCNISLYFILVSNVIFIWNKQKHLVIVSMYFGFVLVTTLLALTLSYKDPLIAKVVSAVSSFTLLSPLAPLLYIRINMNYKIITTFLILAMYVLVFLAQNLENIIYSDEKNKINQTFICILKTV